MIENQSHLLVYVPKISNRVKYTLKLLLTDLLGLKLELTSDANRFLTYPHPKFSYAYHPIATELFFCAKPLLFETGIKDQEIVTGTVWNEPAIFMTNKFSALPFDLFAASFYMVSRYEEYLPNIYDTHQRFESHHSLAYTAGFLQKPVVNIWANMLKSLLSQQFTDLKFAIRQYNYISTIDIDNAWAYRQKGVVRTLGGYLKSLFSLNVKEILKRTRVLMQLEQDPYDTYNLQFGIQRKYNLKVVYFILFAAYDTNDKNVPVNSRKFQELIKSLADRADVGIHPSYASNTNKHLLEREISNLKKVLHSDITKSRQHFLKLNLPDTYNHLIDLGITDDYTMGFASEIGFRAGICDTYNFYNLDTESETKLRIHPFQVMDASLKYYMKVSPEDALSRIKPIIEEVKKVHGTFVSLWHNESLSNSSLWQHWQHVYEQMVMEATA